MTASVPEHRSAEAVIGAGVVRVERFLGIEGRERSEDARRLTAGLAAATKRAYAGAMDRWVGWAVSEGLGLDAALQDRQLARYVDHLRDVDRLAPSSARQALSAIRSAVRSAGYKVDAGPLTTATLRAMSRTPECQDRRRGKVVAVRWPQADTAAELAAQSGTAAGLRDAAIIAVMSDALLRVGELVALDVHHFAAESDGSGRLRVARSKTDQTAEGATLYLGPGTVRRVRTWMDAAGLADGPVFRPLRRGGAVQDRRITTRAVRSIIRMRCAAIGIEGASGHSLRVGGAESLAAAGAGIPEMQAAGRWSDPRMPGLYCAAGAAGRGAIARFRYGVS